MEASSWLQVNCSLFPQLDGTPFLPWRSLLDATEAWRAAGLYQRFWFIRKMPGLKLRFGGPELAARLQAPLAEWLHQAELANEIRGFRFTVYEPETYRFGGEAGMALAHSHFEAGAELVLAYETANESLREKVSRLSFSLANTSDLLDRALADSAESWDVWSRLYSVIEGSDFDPPESQDGEPVVCGFENFLADPAPELADLIAAAQTANAKTADALRALADGGALSVGIRSWLTAAITFEWNRFGLPDHLTDLAAALALILREQQPDIFESDTL